MGPVRRTRWMSPSRLVCLIGCVAVLAFTGCAPAPSPTIEGNVPAASLPDDYRDKPDIKAFALSRSGRPWMTWAYCSLQDAIDVAGLGCERKHGEPCELRYVGANLVDRLDEATRGALFASYQAEARRRSATRPFEPLRSVSYALLGKGAGGPLVVTTGRMSFDPRNICHETIEGTLGRSPCRGAWATMGRERRSSSYPQIISIDIRCDDGRTLNGTSRLTHRFVGRARLVGADGQAARAVLSDRNDFSNLSLKNFELVWRALE